MEELKTIYRFVRISNKRAFDTHERVLVSKLYVIVYKLHGVTKMQTKETGAHFSHVSFGEILWKFV